MSDTIARVRAMREEFDRAFAAPLADDRGQLDDFLQIGAGDATYVVRLSEVAALHADHQAMWLPGPVSSLIGLVGLRGRVLPLYDLRRLLGVSDAAAARWMLVVREREVALAFPRFDGHHRVPSDCVTPARPDDRHTSHVNGVVSLAGATYPLLDLHSIVDAIAALVDRHRGDKEPRE